MAATLVRGAFFSATLQTLLEKLASKEFHDYIRYSKLDVLLLAVLESTLLTLQSVLDDAEEKQFVNAEVKQWLDQLEDTISDAEDLLDEISYDSLRWKVENTQPEFDSEFNYKMRMMCLRLQCFAQQIDILGLQQSVCVRVSCITPSRSVANESVIVGRKDDKERLMNVLLSGSGTSSNNNIGVVAILGVGGVGKTTLAQLVYNDKEVQEHFDLKAWVSVSEDFDIPRVMKALVEFANSRTYGGNDLNYLRFELKKELSGRRFLFVLDDLWNDSYNDWHELVSPLINGKSGSRVIITTRQEKVAEITHTFPIHKLEPLSDEDCWFLLSKHAFGCGGNKYPNLEAIGRKVARKCGGLPIAAKTLGGLLSSKVDAKEWTAILNSDIWSLPNDNILPALLLSYRYLPSYLKRCFAYCSIFPKGYALDRKQLVLLWMAEGFLEHSMGEKAAEEVGDDYFVELLSRSLIEQLNDDTAREKFVMHDLVNDLAAIVSRKSCCRLECGGSISKNVHHLSYNQEEYDIFKKFEIIFDFECLRSFLPIVLRWGPYCYLSRKVVGYLLSTPGPYCYLSRKVVDYLLSTPTRLRVLSLSNYKNITVLPDSVYNLVQLRYLDLSCTGIKSLPGTICDLYYLQTLILSGCMNLIELPVHVGKLINLRHLDISRTKIEVMPTQIVELKNLQTLTVFVVGKHEVGLSMRELGKFPNLRGKLRIQNLHNFINISEACDANLKSKERIEELELYWDKHTEDTTQKVVLDVLQPSINLKKLSIGLYGDTSFPSWLGDSSFSNMVHLCISFCEYCVTLPPVGQLPFLKDLEIMGMSRLETIGPEFYGMIGGGSNSSFQPFPSLENLQFYEMSNWKEWLSFEGGKFPFPRLKTLRLDQCPELRGHLPSYLPSIEEITITFCDHLLATPPTLHWLSSVKSLNIYSRGSTEWSLLGSDSPCFLQHVTIFNLNMLLSLPKMILSSTCLQHVALCYILSPTAFPADGLPTSLQSLRINDCRNLTFLPPETWSNYTSLVALELENCCHALTSFSLNGFPVLQRLSIHRCRNLESIVISESSSLVPSTLQSLKVAHCDALRSLPQGMDTLTALESLTLDRLLSCCEVACLPPKLRLIYIESLKITKPVTEWGLQNLTALSDLHIGGDDIVNTLLKEQLLPISLVSLTVTNLSEMKSLVGDGLQHLFSMENLTFKCCSRLESLPEDTLPSNLKLLVFVNCPKLKSLPRRLPSSLETLEFEDCQRFGLLPKYRLPSSLKLLSILRCPLLKARYESQKRAHMSNIAHVPVIKINYEVTI